MRRHVLMALVMVGVLAAMSWGGAAVYWGDQDGYWDVPGHWVGGLPTAGTEPTVSSGYTCMCDSDTSALFDAVHVGGGSELEVQSGAVISAADLWAGVGSAATIDQSGGTINISGSARLAQGDGGAAVYYLRDGVLDISGSLYLADVEHAQGQSASAELHISGGELNVGAGIGSIMVGGPNVGNSRSYVTITQTGGDVTITRALYGGDFALTRYFYDYTDYSISGGSLEVGGNVLLTGEWYGTYPVFEVVGTAPTVHVGGNYEQGGYGTLRMVIGAGGVSRVDVDGKAYLAGAIDLELDGVTPTSGTTYDLMYAAGGVIDNAFGLAEEDIDDWRLSVVGGTTLRATYGLGEVRHPEWTGAGYDRGPDVFPAYFVDYECHGSLPSAKKAAFECRAPGTWSVPTQIQYATVTDGGGVDGHDCLDRTGNGAWGGAYGAVIYKSGYPDKACDHTSTGEQPMDEVWSLTVCGWFKAEVGEPIGGDARLFARQNMLEVYTPKDGDAGKLAMKIPGGSGSNSADIVLMSDAVYGAEGEWIFFAITYDGTQSSDNVAFYKATQNEKVQLVSTATANAGMLHGADDQEFSIGSLPNGYKCIAGYLDKFTIYAERSNSDKGALDWDDLEKVRRWQANLPAFYPEAWPGDADFDGDVDAADIAIVNANMGQAGYWEDGDFNLDLMVDGTDLAIANGNLGSNPASVPVDVAVRTSMEKIFRDDAVTPDVAPAVDFCAARGERESVQLVVIPQDRYLGAVTVTASDLAHELSGTIGADSISVRRVDSVRVNIDTDRPWPDPLMAENDGAVTPGKVTVFWVEVDVPRHARSGAYSGQLLVSCGEASPIVVGVTLDVWHFTMPAEQNLQTDFWMLRSNLNNCYGVDYTTIDDPDYQQWIDILLDHRLTPGYEDAFGATVTKQADGTFVFDFTELDKYAAYLLGNGGVKFVPAFETYGYDEATGTYREFDPGQSHRDLGSEYWDMLADFCMAAAERYRDDGDKPWSQYAIWFGYDELHPGVPEIIAEHNYWYDTIKAYWPDCRVSTTGEPARYPAYEGHIDIWIPKQGNWDQYVSSHVDRLRAEGDEFWWYQSGCSNGTYISLHTPEPAITGRVFMWQAFDVGVEGVLHWGVNIWRDYRNAYVPKAWRDAYDRWPNTYWNDAGWTHANQYFARGNGHLMFPGPDGPLSTIRLEMVRDGLEDWEMLNMLGKQLPDGSWDGLIGLAEMEGLSSTLINQGKAAADVSSVTSTLTSFTTDPVVLEAQRREIGDAIEAITTELHLYSDPDLDGSGCVDMNDLLLLVAAWLQQGGSLDADFDLSGTVDLVDYGTLLNYSGQGCGVTPAPTPDVYIPFENDNGNPLDTANPAWSNVMVGDSVVWISPSWPTAYPTISSNGLKGDCWYGTNPAMSGSMRTHNWTSGSLYEALSAARSYTITGWVNTRNAALNGSDHYILGQNLPLKYRADGRMQILDGGDWRYTDHGDGSSNGKWVFFAVVRDSSGLTFYHGDASTAVYAGASHSGAFGVTGTNRVVMGGYTYNGNDTYCNFDLDEFRVYSAGDDSAALSLEQLEAIRRHDLGL